jgi:hypothetical protein
VIFGRGGQVRLGGERLQVLAGQLGVGNGEKLLLDFGFGGEVGVAEDACGCGCGLSLKQR